MQGLAIIVRNKEFVKLACILVTSTLLSMGLSDIDSQYLQTVFRFQSRDFAIIFILFGGAGFLVQARCLAALPRFAIPPLAESSCCAHRVLCATCVGLQPSDRWT
jgi:hypothetical protein